MNDQTVKRLIQKNDRAIEQAIERDLRSSLQGVIHDILRGGTDTHKALVRQILCEALDRLNISITDTLATCNQCDWSGSVGECQPDIDGDGGLGCPVCSSVIEVKA